MQVAATDGGCEVENRKGRARWHRNSIKDAVAGDVAAERADRLRQSANLDVHPSVHTEVVDRAAAVRSEHPARVGVVHHHDAAELLGERAQCRQRTEVAVHAEYAVGDEELAL